MVILVQNRRKAGLGVGVLARPALRAVLAARVGGEDERGHGQVAAAGLREFCTVFGGRMSGVPSSSQPWVTGCS